MAIFESYSSDYMTDFSYQQIRSSEGWGQTFTPQQSFTITDMEIYGYRYPIGGTVNQGMACKIYGVLTASIISALPGGTAIASVALTSTECSAWTTTVAWRTIPFGTSFVSTLAVTSGVQLAFVAYSSSGGEDSTGTIRCGYGPS